LSVVSCQLSVVGCRWTVDRRRWSADCGFRSRLWRLATQGCDPGLGFAGPSSPGTGWPRHQDVSGCRRHERAWLVIKPRLLSLRDPDASCVRATRTSTSSGCQAALGSRAIQAWALGGPDTRMCLGAEGTRGRGRQAAPLVAARAGRVVRPGHRDVDLEVYHDGLGSAELSGPISGLPGTGSESNNPGPTVPGLYMLARKPTNFPPEVTHIPTLRDGQVCQFASYWRNGLYGFRPGQSRLQESAMISARARYPHESRLDFGLAAHILRNWV
jgi:hypothetical protein